MSYGETAGTPGGWPSVPGAFTFGYGTAIGVSDGAAWEG